VLREGAGRLTLDAVAREAGLSKGGVLYHFPTKEELLRAMVERWLEDFDAALREKLSQERRAPGAWTRAFVRVSAEDPLDIWGGGAGLFAAIAHDPALLGIVRGRFEEWQRRVEDDGLDPALATVVRLATDGLWWSEVFDFAAPRGALRERVVQRVLAMIEPPTEV
jgi:AcrR family transcriptional regulator